VDQMLANQRDMQLSGYNPYLNEPEYLWFRNMPAEPVIGINWLPWGRHAPLFVVWSSYVVIPR
jgi:hypothetical protein